MVIGTIALTSRSRRRRQRDDDDGDHHDQLHHHRQYAPPPPPLARTSSVMERLRLLGLYRFGSGDFPPEYNHHLSAATHEAGSSPIRQEPVRARHEASASSQEQYDQAVKKSTSGSEVKRLERAPPQAQAQVRRAPRARAPRGLVAREEAAAVSVDARADDFINKFRQQLQLQRLNYKADAQPRLVVVGC